MRRVNPFSSRSSRPVSCPSLVVTCWCLSHRPFPLLLRSFIIRETFLIMCLAQGGVDYHQPPTVGDPAHTSQGLFGLVYSDFYSAQKGARLRSFPDLNSRQFSLVSP